MKNYSRVPAKIALSYRLYLKHFEEKVFQRNSDFEISGLAKKLAMSKPCL